jgi:hypothetical protein
MNIDIDETIKFIISQVPSDLNSDLSHDNIKELLKKFNNDKSKVISYLWDPTVFEQKGLKRQKTKIDEAREISVAFDLAREEYEKEKKKNNP